MVNGNRRGVRYAIHRPVTVVVEPKGEAVVVYARLSNVSKGGAAARLYPRLRVGEQVLLRFECGQTSFEVTGVVRHSRGFMHGFEFCNLLPDQRTELQHAIENELRSRMSIKLERAELK